NGRSDFMKYSCGVLILAFLTLANHAAARDNRAERSMIIALENAWNQAQIHRDGEAINRLVADTFVYTDTDGTLLNKAKFIADSKDPSVETTLVVNDD